MEAQELARGRTPAENELFIERRVQVMKELTKLRCSMDPERIAVNAMLADQSIALMKLGHDPVLGHGKLLSVPEMREISQKALAGLDDHKEDRDLSIMRGAKGRAQMQKVCPT
jgi:hypothetical protein